jgi:DNA invertase Pin-like site-specific DNA recombinase
MYKKKTVIYYRTSTDKQEKGLESQLNALKNYCHQRSIQDYKVFKDFGISGAKESRPALNELMDMVDKGEVKTVICYSFSRFARSTKHLISALESFRERDIAFISITEQIDTSSAIGTAFFTIIAAIAQLERELISERVKNGLENAKSKGAKLGRKRIRNSSLIRELSEKGYSQREIAELSEISKTTVFRDLREWSQIKQSEDLETVT